MPSDELPGVRPSSAVAAAAGGTSSTTGGSSGSGAQIHWEARQGDDDGGGGADGGSGDEEGRGRAATTQRSDDGESKYIAQHRRLFQKSQRRLRVEAAQAAAPWDDSGGGRPGSGPPQQRSPGGTELHGGVGGVAAEQAGWVPDLEQPAHARAGGTAFDFSARAGGASPHRDAAVAAIQQQLAEVEAKTQKVTKAIVACRGQQLQVSRLRDVLVALRKKGLQLRAELMRRREAARSPEAEKTAPTSRRRKASTRSGRSKPATTGRRRPVAKPKKQPHAHQQPRDGSRSARSGAKHGYGVGRALLRVLYHGAPVDTLTAADPAAAAADPVVVVPTGVRRHSPTHGDGGGGNSGVVDGGGEGEEAGGVSVQAPPEHVFTAYLQRLQDRLQAEGH